MELKKAKSVTATAGVLAAILEFVMTAWKVVPGFGKWMTRMFSGQRKVHVWMVSTLGRSATPEEVESFRKELAEVASGSNCIVTGLEVRLLEAKVGQENFVIKTTVVQPADPTSDLVSQ